VTVFRSTSADFCSPTGGSTHKSINGQAEAEIRIVQRKTVTLIYPDPVPTTRAQSSKWIFQPTIIPLVIYFLSYLYGFIVSYLFHQLSQKELVDLT
jgi:hypothetical protein